MPPRGPSLPDLVPLSLVLCAGCTQAELDRFIDALVTLFLLLLVVGLVLALLLFLVLFSAARALHKNTHAPTAWSRAQGSATGFLLLLLGGPWFVSDLLALLGGTADLPSLSTGLLVSLLVTALGAASLRAALRARLPSEAPLAAAPASPPSALKTALVLLALLAAGTIAARASRALLRRRPGEACTSAPTSCYSARSRLVCVSGRLQERQCFGGVGCSVVLGEVRCAEPPVQVGAACEGSARACSSDGRTLLACRGGALRVAGRCAGPLGCVEPMPGVLPELRCSGLQEDEGAECSGGGLTCGADGATLLLCDGGVLRSAGTCAGPGRCIGRDLGGVYPPRCEGLVSEPGRSCLPASFACSSDHRSMLSCEGGRRTLWSPCRGSHGCEGGGEAESPTCDTSLLLLGDPCHAVAGRACSVDGTQVLRCAADRVELDTECRRGTRCDTRDGLAACRPVSAGTRRGAGRSPRILAP